MTAQKNGRKSWEFFKKWLLVIGQIQNADIRCLVKTSKRYKKKRAKKYNKVAVVKLLNY